MNTLLQYIVGVALSIGLAVVLRIEPETTYGWFMGIVHGCLLVPNWIVSLFDPAWLCKAPAHTGGYNACWWTAGVLDALYWLWAAVGAVIAMARGKHSKG